MGVFSKWPLSTLAGPSADVALSPFTVAVDQLFSHGVILPGVWSMGHVARKNAASPSSRSLLATPQSAAASPASPGSQNLTRQAATALPSFEHLHFILAAMGPPSSPSIIRREKTPRSRKAAHVKVPTSGPSSRRSRPSVPGG